MGQKVHPNCIRLGITKLWHSNWYADKKQFSRNVCQDLEIRRFLSKRLANALVSKILIERSLKNIRITVHAARPGIIIGRRGKDIAKLKKMVSDLTETSAHISILEVRRPELDAKLIAESVALQIKSRMMFRRVMKRAVQNAVRLGAKGAKVGISGRLGGAEIARSEWYREGRIPLHTFRADIDYHAAHTATNYGTVGIKVWIFRGEVFEK